MANPFEQIDQRLNRIESFLSAIAEYLPVKAETKTDRPRIVYGIGGLADLLGCSAPTAQKIKDSGVIPYVQTGRKLIFEVEPVLKALEKSTLRHRAYCRRAY